MKKFIAQILLAFPVWLMLGSMSFAMCIWFVPPARNFAPATNMKTLISVDGAQVTMTVQPQFSGDATDFALVMPFPSQPTVEEAPEEIFTELEDLTNPLVTFEGGIALDAAESTTTSNSGVEVIEERDVGDFSTVTLSATDETALIEWLIDEGYEVPDAKQDIIAKYVGDGGYFAALKVNMDKAEVDSDGYLKGELKPISFVFNSTEIMLPLQLMAGEGGLMTLTVYTLGEEFTYVPGAEVQFSKKVDATQLKETPSLEAYDAWQKWLVRNVFQVETAEIKADANVLTTKDTRIVVPGEIPLILNPDQLNRDTGIVISEFGDTVYTSEATEESVTKTVTKDSQFTTAMVVILAISNVVLLVIVVAGQNSRSKK